MSTRFNILLYLGLALSACLLTILAMQLLQAGIWGIDDAYIFFVYAENFANQHGFVYNVGSERVEGFSSMLWQLLLAACYFVGWTGSAAFAILSGLLAALTLWAVCDLVRKILEPFTAGCWSVQREIPLPAILVVAWLIACPAWFIWNVATFMDVALWSCLLTLAVRESLLQLYAPANSARAVWRIALLLGLLVLTRPESLAWGPFFLLAIAAIARWRSESVWSAIRMPLLVFIASLLGLTVFRLLYFGYPLPNTYYAKVAPDFLYRLADGFAYLGKFFSGGGFASLAVLAATGWCLYQLPKLWSLFRGRPSFTGNNAVALFFLSAYVLAALVIVLLEGGDHFSSWRLLQPVYPLLPLFLLYLWIHMLGSRDGFRVVALSLPRAILYMLLVTLVLTAPVRGSWLHVNRTRLLGEFDVAEEGLATARALKQIVLQSGQQVLPMIAVTGAGGFKYAWKGPVLDLLGLNSSAMAHAGNDRQGLNGHAAFNKEVFFREAPQIVIPHLLGWPSILTGCKQLQSKRSFYSRALRGLQMDANFKERYAFVVAGADAGTICMFVERPYLQQLQAGGFNEQ